MSENKKQSMKPALKNFYADKSLSSTQLDALQTVINSHEILPLKKHSLWKWSGALAASILVFFMALSFMQTPAIITSAYVDIYKDANLNNGLQASMQQWLRVNNVGDVPQQYPLKMSKFCRLGEFVTTHLRIAGKQQGEMNVFIHQGKGIHRWANHWLNRSGTVDDMNWKLIKVRDDLTLVVLYTQDMHEKAVQHILSEMLPELRV